MSVDLKQTKVFEIKESVIARMQKERFSLTCAPGGENHAGMEIIGRMPVKGEGLTAIDLEGLSPYFENLDVLNADEESYKDKCQLLDLNNLSGETIISQYLEREHQARVLILRNWVQIMFGDKTVESIYKELIVDEWDAEYLDPNKYRTEIVDGIETKIRGKRLNKMARKNLCYVAGREQEPAVMEGKGRIVDLVKRKVLNQTVETLHRQITEGLIVIDSKSRVEINVVEGNRYYNLKNTGIGFHGDTERVIVICISIGCDNYPMRWQWFKDGMPVGTPIDIRLNCGDVYIMSEKAVGSDWKFRSIYTLRHAAGADKYTNLKRWEKRRPSYDAKIKERADKLAAKKKLKSEKLNFKVNSDAKGGTINLKCKKKKVIIKSKCKKNDKLNRRKTTKNGELKVELVK